MDDKETDSATHNHPPSTAQVPPQNLDFINPLFRALSVPQSHSHTHQHIDDNGGDSSDDDKDSHQKNAPKP